MKACRLALGAMIGMGLASVGLAIGRLSPAATELSVGPERERAATRKALEPRIQLLREGVPADPPPPRFIPVSGDVPAWVAPAVADGADVVVYLHGMCGDPAHAADWAWVAARRATLIALRGDLQCPGGGHYWRGDPTHLDYRVKKTVRSVSAVLGRPLDETSVLLLGYSQGAERAEDLAWVFPKRYQRVGLMSGPRAPRFEHVRRIERLAIVRGEREYSRVYREAAAHIEHAGVPAEFFELPGATHGDFGPEAPEAMGKVLSFLFGD